MKLSAVFLHFVALAAGTGVGVALALESYGMMVANLALWALALTVTLLALSSACRDYEHKGFTRGRSYQLVRDVEELQRHLPPESVRQDVR